jgi:hypothetical protein
MRFAEACFGAGLNFLMIALPPLKGYLTTGIEHESEATIEKVRNWW